MRTPTKQAQQDPWYSFLPNSWEGWLGGKTGRIPQGFGWKGDTNTFYERLRRQGVSPQQFNRRMVNFRDTMGDAYSGGDGDGQSNALKKMFTGGDGAGDSDYFGKIKAFYDAVPQLKNPAVQKQLKWYQDVRRRMPQGAMRAVEDLTGSPLASRAFQKTDQGGYQMPVQQMAQRARELRSALRQRGLEDPQALANFAGRANKALQAYGKPGRELVRRMINSQATGAGDGEIDLATRIGTAQDVLGQVEQLSGNLGRLGIKGQDALRALQQMGGKGITPDPSDTTRALNEWNEILGAAAGADVDVGRMLEPGEGDRPAVMSLLQMLPGAQDPDADPMELFDQRYRDEQGNILADKLQGEIRGFNKVYDDLQGLRQHGDMMSEYGDNLGLDDPRKMVDQYMDDEGNIDWESAEAEVGFWNQAFQWLKDNPKQKGKFDRITDTGKKLSGIGILSKARDKITDWAPRLFRDSEGNLRKRSMSVALSVADWGQYAYKKLFEEKSPLAWLAVAAVAIPVIGGLWKMLGGGRRPAAQMPPRGYGYQLGGRPMAPRPGGPGYGAYQAARGGAYGRLRPMRAAPTQHMTSREWIENF